MIRHQPSPAAVTQPNLRSTSRSTHGTIDRETNLNAAEADIDPVRAGV
jgi:hypothetical protein